MIETASRRGYRFIAGAQPSATRRAIEPNAAAPLPIASVAPAFVIGRDAALARLHAAWSRAAAGERQLCLLAGEAGMGKTTLVDAFVAAVGTAVIVRGHCVEQHGPGEPYLPVLEVLALRSREDPALIALLRAVAPTWLLQLPWLCSEAERESLRRELAGTSPDRMLREFGELLDRYAEERPLLLVTEDLHWSDRATVNLLNHVARRRGPARWMWLATYRPSEVLAQDHPVKALRHELLLHRLCEEIFVDAFSVTDLREYVSRRLEGERWPEAFLSALHRHTGGLPLFVANVVDELLSREAFAVTGNARDAQSAFEALSVPESLAGVMERQILRLPADQTTLLEVASVCGLEFRPSVVAAVLGRDEEWVGSHCELLARRRQWLLPAQVERNENGVLEGRYVFRHALVRHVFRDRMGALTRVRLHHRVAQALEQAAARGTVVSAVELATQFEQGQDPGAAAGHYAAAASAALQHFAPADALQLAERGLLLSKRCRDGESLLELLATLHTLRGAASVLVHGVSADETLQSFEQAREAMERSPQHPLRSLALHGLGLGSFLRHGPARTLELARGSLAQATARGDPILIVTACDLIGQMTKLEGHPHEAIAVLERGIEAASALDERILQAAFVLDPLVNMRSAVAIPLLLAGFDQRSRIQSDLALARANALKQPMARMIATWLSMLCDLRRGDRAPIGAKARQLRAITDEGAVAQGEGPSEWFQGLAEVWSGRGEGLARIEQAYERYASVGMSYGSAEVLGYLSEALILRGEFARADGLLDVALQMAERLGDHSYLVQLLLLKRRVALNDGRTSVAEAWGERAMLEAQRQQSVWQELSVSVALCEDVHGQAMPCALLPTLLAKLPEQSEAPLVRRAVALCGLR